MVRMTFVLVASIACLATASDLDFRPDPGVRVEGASNPAAGVDEAGAVSLYYEDSRRHRQLMATSKDGLAFGEGEKPASYRYDNRTKRLPDGTYRRYQFEMREGVLKSESSRDGERFTPDEGTRYELQEGDRGWMGVYDQYVDAAGGVVLVYLPDKEGLNNLRRAYSPPGDNGRSFRFDRNDVLDDAKLGGGPNSFVDPKCFPLGKGRLRLITMKQGDIYSFLSEDDGKKFRQEEGTRLRCRDFTEFSVMSLMDPVVVRLKDGRCRMYVAALIDAVRGKPGSGRQVIVSATTTK